MSQVTRLLEPRKPGENGEKTKSMREELEGTGPNIAGASWFSSSEWDPAAQNIKLKLTTVVLVLHCCVALEVKQNLQNTLD